MKNLAALKYWLRFDPDTGKFFWVRSKPRVRIGMEAGTKTHKGYVRIECNGVVYNAHTLAWAFTYDVWPDKQLDHINGIRHDNRIANLREATRIENGQNKAIQRNSSSGVAGVSWKASHNKWLAQITSNRKRIFLGYYGTLEAAVKARQHAENELFLAFKPSIRRSLYA